MRMKLGTLKRIIREAVMEAALPDVDAAISRGMVAQNLDRTSLNPYNKYGMDIGRIYITQGKAAADAAVAKIKSGEAAYDAYRKREVVSALANVRGVSRSSLPAERIKTVNMLIDKEERWGNPDKETVDLLNANKGIYQKYLNKPQIDSLEELTEDELAELEAAADQLKANDDRIEDITHEYMMKFSPGSAAHRKNSLEQNRLEAIKGYIEKQRQMQGQAR